MFISIEGADGVGKTTQAALLAEALGRQGYRVASFRDPGSTSLGEALRELLLRRAEIPLGPMAEMLLYMAARAQLVEEAIRPALDQGAIVICDRYLLSNVVYQGYGCGLDVGRLWEIGQFITRGLLPDLTIILDLPEELAADRRGPAGDRVESRDKEFHRRIRNGFLAEAAKNPHNMVVVDSRVSAEAVHRTILNLIMAKMSERISARKLPSAEPPGKIFPPRQS
jgi:dTMP kinase